MSRPPGPVPARVDYAVRALLGLARAAPATVTAAALARSDGIPKAYLYDVLAALRRADLVRAVRGTDGGFGLNRPPERITLGDVLRALDSVLLPVAPARSPSAPGGPASGDLLEERLRRAWAAADDATLEALDKVSLADLFNK
jgi:Rrf2 family protein